MRTLRAVGFALVVAALSGCPDMSGPASEASVKIINRSSEELVSFYYWRCGITIKGPNRLSKPIQPNTDRTFDGIEPGCYNLQVVAASGLGVNREEELKRNTVLELTIR